MSASTGSEPYVFAAPVAAERRRLAGIEDTADPGTHRILDALGVTSGWSCVEVGAGGGSIARWLADRVGPSGHVLALDLEPAVVDDGGRPNLEVRRHDVVTDALPAGVHDLVHARLLLAHLGDWEIALNRCVAALRPGGVLVVEDYDWVSWVADPGNDPEANTVHGEVEAAVREFALAHGYDMFFGRTLARRLAAAGLVDVAAEGRTHLDRGGSAHMAAHRLSREHLRAGVLAAGAVDADEFDRALALLDDPDFRIMCPTMIAAWGRTPP